jgi:hypothetical protein
MSEEDLFSQVEDELKGKLPEECINKFKRFQACRLDKENEEKAKGFRHVKDQQTLPLAYFEGCRKEWENYNKCKEEFFWRYIDLKNYVAEIEGKQHPFNKTNIKDYLEKTYDKFAVNKF